MSMYVELLINSFERGLLTKELLAERIKDEIQRKKLELQSLEDVVSKLK